MADVCTFYSKIGACRHGDKCSRRHIHPRRSDTIRIFNLYRNQKASKHEQQKRFDQFYTDVFVYIAQIGEIDSMVVCENDSNHLNGNVYVKLKNEATAGKVMYALNQQWYDALPIHCELSPVESFADANCRAYDTGTCSRGGQCNFMHIRRPSPDVKALLYRSQDKWIAEKALERAAPEDPAVVEIRERNRRKEEKKEEEQLKRTAVVTSEQSDGKLVQNGKDHEAIESEKDKEAEPKKSEQSGEESTKQQDQSTKQFEHSTNQNEPSTTQSEPGSTQDTAQTQNGTREPKNKSDPSPPDPSPSSPSSHALAITTTSAVEQLFKK